ncbi:MAG TPA: helix-turn-helix domain-containing protein [Gaiellaceae bacterium]|nr:helix-turn-helix domain-containing protein [Gaiellaceae bacterium]
MEVVVRLDDLREELLDLVRAEVHAVAERGGEGWLDAKRAAGHLSLSEEAVRALVKRREIPFAKAPNGRLLFDRAELDLWVRGEAA